MIIEDIQCLQSSPPHKVAKEILKGTGTEWCIPPAEFRQLLSKSVPCNLMGLGNSRDIQNLTTIPAIAPPSRELLELELRCEFGPVTLGKGFDTRDEDLDIFC